MNRFQERVALVTGGASGIGESVSVAFANEGANVVVTDVSKEKGQAVVDSIKRSGGKATFIQTDVSKPQHVKSLMMRIEDTYGRLDCAVNNAGVGHTPMPLHKIPVYTWEHIINVNLTGIWLCMKFELPLMLKQGSGVIVNVASIGGLIGGEGIAAYCASKGGVVQLTRAAAMDYAKLNIRINAVCPGTINTPLSQAILSKHPEMKSVLVDIHPIGRVGEPEEVSNAILWLCSNQSSFITGICLPIDGGATAK